MLTNTYSSEYFFNRTVLDTLPKTTRSFVENITWITNPRIPPNGSVTVGEVGNGLSRIDSPAPARLLRPQLIMYGPDSFDEVFTDPNWSVSYDKFVKGERKRVTTIASNPTLTGVYLTHYQDEVRAWTAFHPRQDQLNDGNPLMQHPYSQYFPEANPIPFIPLMKHVRSVLLNATGRFAAIMTFRDGILNRIDSIQDDF